MKNLKLYRIRINGTDQYFDGFSACDTVNKVWKTKGAAKSAITYFIKWYHPDFNKNVTREVAERADLVRRNSIIEECILIVRDIEQYEYKEKSS